MPGGCAPGCGAHVMQPKCTHPHVGPTMPHNSAGGCHPPQVAQAVCILPANSVRHLGFERLACHMRVGQHVTHCASKLVVALHGLFTCNVRVQWQRLEDLVWAPRVNVVHWHPEQLQDRSSAPQLAMRNRATVIMPRKLSSSTEMTPHVPGYSPSLLEATIVVLI